MSRLHKNKQYFSNVDWTAKKVKEEINSGLEILNKIDRKIITFFGAHRINEKNKYYMHCKKVAFELGKKNYAVMSGGGPGIMHASNLGAHEANAPSIGFRAELLGGEKVKDKKYDYL